MNWFHIFTEWLCGMKTSNYKSRLLPWTMAFSNASRSKWPEVKLSQRKFANPILTEVYLSWPN